ncbi:MAG TPA: hypothetical protein VEZ20_06880 [Allosphingosinicella sp.]|nr:hypothetical protein [Allosphingosinicella sp.]
MLSPLTASGLLGAILSASATAGIAASAPPAALQCEQTRGQSCDSAGRCEAVLDAASATKFYLIIRLADNSYRHEMRFADGGTVAPASGRITLLNRFEDAANPLGFRVLLENDAVVTIFRARDDADRFEAVLQKAAADSAAMYWYACSSRAVP